MPIPDGGWEIVARDLGPGFTSTVTVATDERFDGSFTVQLTLPDTFPSGEAFASIENWDYSFCTDANTSCASASATFYVE